MTSPAPSPSLFERGERILFQGDSITDMGRGRTEDPNHILGHGYAFIIAAMEGAEHPRRNLVFLNRGMGGHTSADLAARWQEDTIELKPHVLSILIGVNDINRKLRAGESFSAAEYEETYAGILERTAAALPGVKLILGEPFFTPGTATQAFLAQWPECMRAAHGVVHKLAEEYRAPVVRYQRMFDAAGERAPFEYWIWDGIHPTYSGHQLMADEWRRTYREFYGAPSDEPARNCRIVGDDVV